MSDYKFKIGEGLILTEDGTDYKCTVVRYQKSNDYAYVVKVPDYPYFGSNVKKETKEYGAKESQLRRVTKLDKALQ